MRDIRETFLRRHPYRSVPFCDFSLTQENPWAVGESTERIGVRRRWLIRSGKTIGLHGNIINDNTIQSSQRHHETCAIAQSIFADNDDSEVWSDFGAFYNHPISDISSLVRRISVEAQSRIRSSPWCIGGLGSVHDQEVREHFLGVVQEVLEQYVVVDLRFVDGDAHSVRIPKAAFDAPPIAGEEIECTLTTIGPKVLYSARKIGTGNIPTLEELGLDTQELLEWASNLDI